MGGTHRHGCWPNAPDIGAESLIRDGWQLDDRSAAERPAVDVSGRRQKAEKVVGLRPNGGTLAIGWNDGFQTSGKIVRVMTFQSCVRWMGITGWMFRTSCVPLFGPKLKFVLL